MSASGRKERRMFTRIPASAILEYSPVSELGPTWGSSARSAAEVLDLSMGGLLFTVDRELEAGSRVLLQLDVASLYDLNFDWKKPPGSADLGNIQAVAEVVRIKGAEEIGWEVGVKIVAIDEENSEVLQKALMNQ